MAKQAPLWFGDVFVDATQRLVHGAKTGRNLLVSPTKVMTKAEVRASKKKYRKAVVGVAVMASMYAFLWIIWAAGTSTDLTRLTSRTLTLSGINSYLTIAQFLVFPESLVSTHLLSPHNLQQQFDSGQPNPPLPGAHPFEPLSNHTDRRRTLLSDGSGVVGGGNSSGGTGTEDLVWTFLSVMDGALEIDTSLLAAGHGDKNSADFYYVQYVYVGWEDGSFSGVGFVPQTSDSTQTRLFRGLRSVHNDWCYSKYHMRTNDGPWPVVEDQPYWKNDNCAYDPRVRPWYTEAKENHTAGWSDVYMFAGNTRTGITRAWPILSPTGELLGVLAVDVMLTAVDSMLTSQMAWHQQKASRENSWRGIAIRPAMFIMDATRHELIATSAESHFVETRRIGIDLIPRHSLETQDRTTQEARQYLSYAQNHSQLPNVQNVLAMQVIRTQDAPLTVVSGLWAASGLDWVVVVCLPREDFWTSFDTSYGFGLICTLGAMMAVWYLVLLSFKEYSLRRRASPKTVDEAVDSMGGSKVERDVLVEAVRRHEKMFREAWRKRWPGTTRAFMRMPMAQHDIRESRTNMAIDCINYPRADRRNVLTAVSLMCIPSASAAPLRVYLLYTSRYYQWGIWLVMCLHICLSFALRPQLGVFHTPPLWFVLAEVACWLLEVADFAVSLQITFHWRVKAFPVLYQTAKIHSAKRVALTAIHAVLLVVILGDMIFTGAGIGRLECIAPVRPLLMIFRVRELRQVGNVLLSTVSKARNVFLLYVSLLLTAALAGITLFRDRLDPGELDIQETNAMAGRSYSNYLDALITSFIFLTTGENYTELVPNALKLSYWYVFYFMIFNIIGMLICITMVIGYFQSSFRQAEKRYEDRRKSRSRMGMVGAFVMLTLDKGRSLHRSSVVAFIRRFRPGIPESAIDEALEWEQTLEIDAFVHGIEKILWARQPPTAKAVLKIPLWRLVLQQNFFETNGYKYTVFFLVMSNVWLVSLYGAQFSPISNLHTVVDVWCAILLLLYVIELTVKVVAYGPHEFWFYARYRKFADEHLFQMQANRFDSIVIVFSSIMWIAFRGLSGDAVWQTRFVMNFPILRLFSVVSRTRKLVFTLINVLHSFTNVIVLMLLVLYFYAQLGTFLFSDLKIILQDESPLSGFSSLQSALVTLFQLLVGEGWHDVMYNAIRVNGIWVSWYFISYIIIITILFSNLLIGIVLDEHQGRVPDDTRETKTSTVAPADHERSRSRLRPASSAQTHSTQRTHHH